MALIKHIALVTWVSITLNSLPSFQLYANIRQRRPLLRTHSKLSQTLITCVGSSHQFLHHREEPEQTSFFGQFSNSNASVLMRKCGDPNCQMWDNNYSVFGNLIICKPVLQPYLLVQIFYAQCKGLCKPTPKKMK